MLGVYKQATSLVVSLKGALTTSSDVLTCYAVLVKSVLFAVKVGVDLATTHPVLFIGERRSEQVMLVHQGLVKEVSASGAKLAEINGDDFPHGYYYNVEAT